VADQCGHILTESGSRILTEDGRSLLVTECYSPSPFQNPAGRIYKGKYPYWQERRKPYWERAEDVTDEEELLILSASDL
jgi:hypothetical protein